MNANWLRNFTRNSLKGHLLGELLIKGLSRQRYDTICFVAATRMSETDFWKKSYLGPSLQPLLQEAGITAKIYFENTLGLPEVYNREILESRADILVFLHDDVWLADLNLPQKISYALKNYDIVGLAGNKNKSKRRITWFASKALGDKFIPDKDDLSGIVAHGHPERHDISYFGPTPAQCQVMDGLFLAATTRRLRGSKVKFDERFKFHFYDLDFCNTAKRAGLTMGTWPIDAVHASTGAYNSESWRNALKLYQAKWE